MPTSCQYACLPTTPLPHATSGALRRQIENNMSKLAHYILHTTLRKTILFCDSHINGSKKWPNTCQIQRYKYYSPTLTNTLIQMITFPSCITKYNNANTNTLILYCKYFADPFCFQLKLKDFRPARFLIL